MGSRAAGEKHAEWYRLYLMGWNFHEIGAAYSVAPSSVCRAVEKIRHEHSWADRNARQRFTDLISDVYDGARLAMKESYRKYVQLHESKPETAARFLTIAESGLQVLARLVPDQQTLAFEEEIVHLRRQQEEIQKDWAEKRLKDRVLPASPNSG
jgi:ABC-type sulfate transport system substrate-binding protein